jgi:hypothetical protein
LIGQREKNKFIRIKLIKSKEEACEFIPCMLQELRENKIAFTVTHERLIKA